MHSKTTSFTPDSAYNTNRGKPICFVFVLVFKNTKNLQFYLIEIVIGLNRRLSDVGRYEPRCCRALKHVVVLCCAARRECVARAWCPQPAASCRAVLPKTSGNITSAQIEVPLRATHDTEGFSLPQPKSSIWGVQAASSPGKPVRKDGWGETSHLC